MDTEMCFIIAEEIYLVQSHFGEKYPTTCSKLMLLPQEGKIEYICVENQNGTLSKVLLRLLSRLISL